MDSRDNWKKVEKNILVCFKLQFYGIYLNTFRDRIKTTLGKYFKNINFSNSFFQGIVRGWFHSRPPSLNWNNFLGMEAEFHMFSCFRKLLPNLLIWSAEENWAAQEFSVIKIIRDRKSILHVTPSRSCVWRKSNLAALKATGINYPLECVPVHC